MTGEEVEIGCRAGGDPQPKVTWRKVGGALPEGSSVRPRGLKLAPLRTEDAGLYVCEASNTVSSIHANASLVVHCEYQEPTGSNIITLLMLRWTCLPLQQHNSLP